MRSCAGNAALTKVGGSLGRIIGPLQFERQQSLLLAPLLMALSIWISQESMTAFVLSTATGQQVNITTMQGDEVLSRPVAAKCRAADREDSA